jgi:hypothetical protein
MGLMMCFFSFFSVSLAGHMGCDQVTVMGLMVYGLDVVNNIIALKGSVPGHAESVCIYMYICILCVCVCVCIRQCVCVYPAWGWCCMASMSLTILSRSKVLCLVTLSRYLY